MKAKKTGAMLRLDTSLGKLLKVVRAHMAQRGTSLAAFCAAQGFFSSSSGICHFGPARRSTVASPRGRVSRKGAGNHMTYLSAESFAESVGIRDAGAVVDYCATA